MNLEKLRGEYKKARPAIKAALEGYKKANDYFYEMCFCLLTPQSSAFKCDACIHELKQKEFHATGVDIVPILRKYTRFHHTKARYLSEFRQNHHTLLPLLRDRADPGEKREFLASHVKGLGMKEASHFLRNIGFRNLAILDRHILKNLKKYGAIKALPKTLTKKKYLQIEKKFKEFSEKVGIPMDELDLLFWSMQTGKVFK